MKKQKVIAIHDISCIGRCSLTVALPVLSAAGIETCVIPTAVLSTHTGGFEGFTFRDLTSDIEPIAEHWKALDIHADAIYTGYVGSKNQLEIISRIIDLFNAADTYVMVDPVMGDSGRFYTAIDSDFVGGMRKLCSKADIIVPNLTEACMLLDIPYCDGRLDEGYVKKILKELCQLGCGCAVLSGISLDGKTTGAMAYDSKTDTFCRSFTENIEGFYHGSGDVFASSLLGALMNGFEISAALDSAVGFTFKCICRTRAQKTDTRFGLDFERELGGYIRSLGISEKD